MCILCLTAPRFRAGTSILGKKQAVTSVSSPYLASTYAKPFRAPLQLSKPRPVGGYIPASTNLHTPLRVSTSDTPTRAPSACPSRNPSFEIGSAAAAGKAVSQSSFYAQPKQPLQRVFIGEKSSKARDAWGGARHDPNAEGAVVMPRPTDAQAKQA